MIDEVYYQYNPWWEDEVPLKGIIERPGALLKLDKSSESKSIVIITGLRRVGKTTLIKLFISKLIQKGIPPRNIFYVSLDDFILEKKSVIDIVSDYRKIQKLSLSEKVYLFFDEVAHKPQFHQQLKNLYDNQDVKIYASSSSSSILKDGGAYLTGREVVIELFPLNFYEYCDLLKVLPKKSEEYLRESYFEEYLKYGGMPEFVIKKEREYLTTLVDDIIYKDIVAFHNIKAPHIVRDFFALLMERSGKQVSINKLASILKISPDTAKRFLSMFEETYLVYLVSRHGTLNETMLSPKKVYAADLGMRNIFTGFRDKGALFENYVYLTIKSSNPQYINKSGIEIDFFTADKMLIEVKYGGELTEKQKMLFEGIEAKKKFIIQNLNDLEGLTRNI